MRIGIVLPPDPDAAIALAELADSAGIEAVWVEDEAFADLVRDKVHRTTVLVVDQGNAPSQRTVALSIGRTLVEAQARAEMDSRVTSFPAEARVFGSLEDCQAAVTAFADQGFSDLRCVIPQTPDIHDLVAQLTALRVGAAGVGRATGKPGRLPPRFSHDAPEQGE